MSGWAQREAERKEDEANEMDELITEVRELRAELAAAKEHLGIAINNAAGWRKRTAERRQGMKALAADNERLRATLELGECYMKVFRRELARNNATFEGSEDQAEVDGDLAKVQYALAATPAQSLVSHDAAVKVEVLREVIEELRDMARDRDDSAYDIAAYTVEQKADRIEQEAPHA